MHDSYIPKYVKLHNSGEIKKRAEALKDMMKKCYLCPRICGAERLNGKRGFCGTDNRLIVSSYHPHFGEEKGLVGKNGSGTIFFANCSLRCVFCQNWDISHLGRGRVIDVDELSSMMIELQNMGCHNINLVTPTHYAPYILESLDIAASNGLRIPVVWNTSGWERLEVLKLLDGIIDIYMPDFKYFDEKMAERFSFGAKSYPEIVKKAVIEMNRQVGVAKPYDGIIYTGLIIRILVMPGDVSGSQRVVEWISENLPKDTYINIMSQYFPQYMAFDYPEISRRITKKEYEAVVKRAKDLGLTNLDIQGI